MNPRLYEVAYREGAAVRIARTYGTDEADVRAQFVAPVLRVTLIVNARAESAS